MFERFTDRARKALVVAQEEARALETGFIGPEHLVLGLFQVEGGVAAIALRQAGAELEAFRAQVESATVVRQRKTIGKPPFTPQAKKVLELALREALGLGHNYIGTEHVLLGVLRGAGKDDFVVAALGVDPELLRANVLEVLKSHAYGIGTTTRISRATPAFEEALGRARRHAGAALTTTAHLVAAVLADPRSQGATALGRLGVTAESYAEALAQTPVEGTSDGPRPTLEVKLGEQAVSVDDPELVAELAAMSPDQLREALGRLKDVLRQDPGPEAAA